MKKISLFVMLIGVLSACSANNSQTDFDSQEYRCAVKARSTERQPNQVGSTIYYQRCMQER